MSQSTQPSSHPPKTENAAPSGPTPPGATLLDYHATSFSAGRMDFQWEELSEEDRAQTYADWAAGKGLMGGDPRQRPDAHLLPDWGIDHPFFRALTQDDTRGNNGARLRADLAT
ncbi:MAG: hypothetical protein WDZ49_09840, partial [Litorilinea sp.]